MNFSTITLGELLSHANETIRRNAISILKQLQRSDNLTTTATGHHLAPLCRYCINTAKVECNIGHVYCPKCEMDVCDIPL